jgi:hypothetical protein
VQGLTAAVKMKGASGFPFRFFKPKSEVWLGGLELHIKAGIKYVVVSPAFWGVGQA